MPEHRRGFPTNRRRISAVTPAANAPATAAARETPVWDQLHNPQRDIAQHEIRRIEAEMAEAPPEQNAERRRALAEELLTEVNTLIVAKTIIARLAADTGLSPRTIYEHAELALIQAAEALFPDDSLTVALTEPDALAAA